jgi:hypothetical protein
MRMSSVNRQDLDSLADLNEEFGNSPPPFKEPLLSAVPSYILIEALRSP